MTPKLRHSIPLALLILSTFTPLCVSAAAPAKPNIVIILTDDAGYADVSINGCKDFKTPHIDSLAHNGVRCTSGYVTQPQCSPSRAGLLTGCHQSRFGHEENPPNKPDPKVGLPLTEKTIADHLKAAGYVTGHVGKWHQGHHTSKAPLQRGFMESMSTEDMFDSEEAAAAYDAAAKKSRARRGKYGTLWRNGKPEPLAGYVADAQASEVVGFIDRHHAEPFLLYWAHPFPHVPVVTDEKYLKRVAHIADEARRQYASMMLAVDDGVGRMLEALRKHGIEERTLIFYMNDNGGPSNGRLPCFNTPFTGNKGNLKEGGIRVPYFVQWQGTLPAGRIYDRAVSTLDVLPTALAAAGANPLPDTKLDGVNLLPFLKDEATGEPHERLHWRYLRRNMWATREGDWKLLKTKGKNEALMLYDLSKDPAEATDLASQFPDRVTSMKADYEAWVRDLPQPLWMNTKDEED